MALTLSGRTAFDSGRKVALAQVLLTAAKLGGVQSLRRAPRCPRRSHSLITLPTHAAPPVHQRLGLMSSAPRGSERRAANLTEVHDCIDAISFNELKSTTQR